LDGTRLKNESGRLDAKYIFPHSHSYITGKIKDNFLDGDCKIILDGKYEIPGLFENKKLFIKSPTSFISNYDS